MLYQCLSDCDSWFFHFIVNITGFELFGYGSNVSAVRFGDIEAEINYSASSPSFISVRVGNNSNLANDTNVIVSIISDTHAIVDSSLSTNWTYLREGVIDSVTPSRGQFGSLITIRGTNLLGGGASVTQIYVDSIAPSIVSFNESEIVVRLGDHLTRNDNFPAGKIYIESDTGAIVRGGTFEQLVPGNITSLSPSTGRQGTIVTVYGFNLRGYGSAITSVSIAGYEALSEVYETDSSDSTLIIRVNAAPNGTSGPIRILTDTGAVIESNEFFTYMEPGNISTVSPSTGAEGVGLLITGTLLQTGDPVITNVTIGGSEVKRIVTYSSTQVTIITGPAPGEGGGSLPIRVISSDGSFIEGGSFTYQNLSLSVVGQTSGQTGTQVTLTAPFPAADVRSVYFDDQEATIITVQEVSDNSSIVAVTTPRPQRLGQFTADISIENIRHIFARLIDGFTYLPEGAIYSVTPSFGQSGTRVTLSGERLLGGGSSISSVSIGGITATISNYSDTDISVSLDGNLPNGQGSYSDIYIISNTGATITRLNGFMFIQPGEITSVSPSVGQYGTIVTLRGTGLLQGSMDIASVTVAGIEAVLLHTPNNTLIQVQLMPGSEETGSVIITLESGAQISSNGLQFTYVQGNITAISPSIGTEGTLVSITGTDLRGGGLGVESVSLDGFPAVIISESDTNIVVRASAGVANETSGSVEIVSNTGSIVSLESSWTYKGLGNITSCLPLSGQQGVTVTIEGIDLIGSTGSEIINVTLAGVPGIIVSQTNTTVQVIAGYSNSSTSGPVIMSVSTGPVLTSSFNWSYYEAVLVSVSPSTGVNGTYVLLNGTNIIGEPNSLDTVMGVSFGSIPAFDVVVLSSNLVRVRAGHFPTASGPLTVQINSTSGAYLTLSNQWVFREPGQVTDIGPSAAAPGSNVTISGTSLVPGDAAGVTVVTGQTGSFEAWIVNSSTIVFRAGLYVGNDDPNIPLPILIIASNGSTLQSLAPLFSFESVNMTVTSVTPVAGGEGSVVVINGTNLLNGGSAIRSVYLAGSLVANFSVNADYTSISVTAGAGDSVEGNVIIENDNGLLYGNYSWAYLPALTSDQVTPTTGRNGTSVIINAGSVPPQYTLQSVTLGGIEASNISNSNGDILVIAPPGTSPGSVVLHFQDGIYLVIPNSWTPQPTVNISSVNTLVGYYGTLVVITGSGFQGIGGASRLIVSSVTIAGFNTKILSQNNMELRMIIDENFNSSGSGNITGPIIIRNQDDSVYDSSSQDITFTYLQVSIETVSPSNGQNGTEVVIEGINLLCGGNGISSITLAGIAVSSINMATDSIIKVTAGYSNTETAPSNVSYITDNGAQVTIATSWSYVRPGVISTISPASGQRGTTITITGQDMLGGGERVMSVILNGVPTMDVVVSHNDFVQVRAGDSIASGPGQVIVIADTGAALYSNVTEVNFQYISPSQITSFSPLSGQYGTIVTINGTALYPVEAGISTVLLNGIPASILSSNTTSITVSAGRPSFIGSSAGTVSVVSNDGSLTESSVYFTYLLEGEIYSVEPPQGQKDTRVLISGRGLRGGGSDVDYASIAGIPATIVSQSDSMIELIANENKESQSGSVSGNISLVSNTGAEVIRLNAWKYVQTGIVYSLVPDFGQFGTYISITGERLTAGGDNIVQVFIDDVPSLSVESSNETQVVFRAGRSPSINATTITFISNHGGNLTQSNISWRYEETSEIFSLSPINGTGASIVNITGSNLLGGGSSIVNVVLAGIKVRKILNSSDTLVVVEAGFNRDGQPKSGNVTLEADTGALTVLVDGWSYLSECPHGQFGNDSESCMTCHPQCNHCYGPSEFECYACLNFKLTHDDQRFECISSCPSVSTLDKTCVAECSSFQYRANLNDGYTYCLNCSSLCDPNSGCTGPHPSQCVACSYYKERGECVSQCSTGSYISNKTCLPCSEQCLQSEDCYGPGSTQCNACLNVSITRQSQNKTSYDECIPACPTTYYTDEQNHCQSCHAQCLGGCSGPTSTQCSNCTNAFIARPNNTRECVEDCNADSSLKTMYRDTSTSECKACHQYCSVTAGCTGPTAGDCVSCSNFTSGSHVLWTEFIPKLNGECVTLCPNESYYVDLRNGNCELCDPSCFNGCTGPSSGDCIVVLSTESPTLTMTGEPSSAGPFSAGIGTIIITAVIIVLLIVAFLIVLVILIVVKTKGRKDYKIEAEHELEPHSYRRNPISETNLGTNPYITAHEASMITEMPPPRPSRSTSLENPLFQATNIELLEEDERSFGRSLDRLNEQTSRPTSPDRPSSPDADEHSSLLRQGGGDAPPPVPGHQRGSKDVSALRQNSIPASQPQLRPPISSPLNFTNDDDDDDDNDGEMYTEMDPAPHDNLEIMTQDEYVDVDVSSPLPRIDIQQADDAVYEETDSTAHDTSNITGAIKTLPFRQAPLPSPSDSVPPAIPPKPDPNRPVLPPRKSVSSSALSSSSGGRFVPEPRKRLSIDPQTIEEYYEDIIPAGGTEKPPAIIPRQQRK